jgi:NADH-quinone oxidoreductase subunit M
LLIIFGLLCLFFFYLIFYYYLLILNINNNNLFWSIKQHTLNFSFFFITKFSPDLFGLVLLLIAVFIGFISFFTLDTRIFYINFSNFILCYFLIFFIFLFAFCTDIVFFFLCYEGLLLPSFWLVYFLSPNRRGVQASIYFLLWTQLGSFLVFIFISYSLLYYKVYFFNDFRFINFYLYEIWFLYILLFFGFGFKVPVWPFHFWLTKTHVEAPTGFSIFLSGFLVKSALFGFYKFTTSLSFCISTSFFVTITIIGIIDSSLKMWGQSDLKKLVAYGTIQEMNIIFLTFCYGDSFLILSGILFCITHALLSSLFFFIVDCVYRRYKTRNIIEIQGLLHITPNLGIFIFFSCLLYSGLPGTLKFICELYIFSGLFETAPISVLLILYSANFVGIVGFCKCWFNILFGLNLKFQKLNLVDLTMREILIKLICCFNLLFFGVYLPWFF